MVKSDYFNQFILQKQTETPQLKKAEYTPVLAKRQSFVMTKELQFCKYNPDHVILNLS